MSQMAALFAALFTGVAIGASGHEYVVVGGGVAGSIVATRLAERHSVLLLNIAGAAPMQYNGPVISSDELIVKKNLSATSGMSARIRQPGYKPVPFFSTGETGSSPARYLGGSSLVGLSHFLYDKELDWASGWDWNVMQNYMLKSKIQPTHHPAYLHPLTQDFLKAVPTAQATPTSQRPDGTKITAHAAYIANQVSPKLTIMENVRVDKLVIKDGICVGVMVKDLVRGGYRFTRAEKEVIVSAGYLYTPKLLFLSGIGDAKKLAAKGIEVVQDLPAVGKNLTAPRFTPVSWHTETPTLSQMMGPPISTGPSVPEAFNSVMGEATVQLGKDAMVQFMPLYYAPASAPLPYSLQGEPWPLKTNAFTMLVTMTTEAKGAVEIEKDPDVSPTIIHEPMTPADLERGAKAVRMAEEFASKLPSTGRVEHGVDWSAVYDGRGSCRMGTNPHTSVVDTMLRVHGIKGLRIVDGSVLPSNTPYLAMPEVIMVAERAVDLILDVKTYPVDLKHKDESPFYNHVNEILALEAASQPFNATSNSVFQSLQSVPLLTLGAALGFISTMVFQFLFRRRSQMAEADYYLQA